MHPNARYRVPATLDVIPFTASPGDLDWVRCPQCDVALSLHQPNQETPDRLLGVCECCKRWTLIDLILDKPEALMTLLPDSEMVRSLSRTREPVGLPALPLQEGAG